jgi:hypothetical protein
LVPWDGARQLGAADWFGCVAAAPALVGATEQDRLNVARDRAKLKGSNRPGTPSSKPTQTNAWLSAANYQSNSFRMAWPIDLMVLSKECRASCRRQGSLGGPPLVKNNSSTTRGQPPAGIFPLTAHTRVFMTPGGCLNHWPEVRHGMDLITSANTGRAAPAPL